MTTAFATPSLRRTVAAVLTPAAKVSWVDSMMDIGSYAAEGSLHFLGKTGAAGSQVGHRLLFRGKMLAYSRQSEHLQFVRLRCSNLAVYFCPLKCAPSALCSNILPVPK